MMKFSIVGDSNVVRHMNQANCRSPELSEAEVKSCGKLVVLEETLRSIRAETTVILLSCLTNFITDCTGSTESISLRIEPVLVQVRDILFSFCQEQPERHWLMAPPMYRTSPVWYVDGLSEVMIKFSEAMQDDPPRNFHLLPSFPSPNFEADGVHLSPYSGYQFILHLFDSAKKVMAQSKKPPSSLIPQQSESIRCLEDRVTVIEQDHQRLSKSCELKYAVQAEINEYHENLRYIKSNLVVVVFCLLSLIYMP